MYLDFIIDFIDDHEYPPTIREMQKALSVSSSSVVTYWLRKLEASGAIKVTPGISRGIRVMRRAADA
jgi:repressor LexA